MVFQRPNPLPISIYENIIFGLKAHTPRGQLRRDSNLDDIVEAALREVQLWDATKNKLRNLATSLTLEQQQKLCIARLPAPQTAHHLDGRALLGPRRRGHRTHRGAHQ